MQRRRSSRLTAKYKGAYRPRPRSISTWKAKKFVVCPFYEQMGATRGATALTLWPKRPFPCRNLDLRYVRAYLRDPQLERTVHRSQNRIESYHQLRSAIAQVGGKKELAGRTDIELEISNQCGRLIANAIIYYNSAILSRLLTRYEASGNTNTKARALITHISAGRVAPHPAEWTLHLPQRREADRPGCHRGGTGYRVTQPPAVRGLQPSTKCTAMASHPGVWVPTPLVQFHAQPKASVSKKPAVWAWNPRTLLGKSLARLSGGSVKHDEGTVWRVLDIP